MEIRSQRTKTNFDRLEAAGLVAGEDQTAVVKAKVVARLAGLSSLATKLQKVQVACADLYVLEKPARLKKLTSIISAVKRLSAEKLPVSTKTHVENCLNELTSLREGIYTASTRIGKKELALLTVAAALTDIEAMVVSSSVKLEKITADSSNSADLDEFYKKAADVIEKHSKEQTKVTPIQNKPFIVLRLPVVPADGGLSVDKLTRLGFSTENLSGYAVLHNQLIIGINPNELIGDTASSMRGETAAKKIREEAERIKKVLEKKTKVRLQFVSEKAFSFESGTWFWLMPNREIDAFAKAFPGSHIKVQRWGFAFNAPSKLDKASDPNMSNKFLTMLSKDKDDAVRLAVAENPKTPEDVLVELSEDPNEAIRFAANQKRKQ